jgi:hypothetical protein
MRRSMRRKSLQDIIGTVGGKITRRKSLRPLVDFLQPPDNPVLSENSGRACKSLPVGVPDSGVNDLSSGNEGPGPLNAFNFEISNPQPHHVCFQVDLPTNRLCITTNSSIRTLRSHRIPHNDGGKDDPFIEHPDPSSVSPLGNVIGVPQIQKVLDESNECSKQRHSEDSGYQSTSPSPHKLLPTVPIDFLRDISPKVPAHIR